MAQGYSAETVGVLDGSVIPAALGDGRLLGGRVRGYVATFDLSLAAVKKASGDTNVCFDLPAGEKPFRLSMSASATMGATATIAIGNATTADKYRVAAVHTVTTLVTSMINTTLDDVPLAAKERVIFTIASADLPASGILIIMIETLGR